MCRSIKSFLKKIIAVALLIILLFGMSPAVNQACAAIPQTYSPGGNELWIKVDKNKLQLTLRRGLYEILQSYPVAIGRVEGEKRSRTDMITPVGVFTIWRVIEDATQLVFDPRWFGEPGEPQKGVYGAKLISFYNPWEIAIHGTNAPSSIGTRVTRGCIRMHNRDITELAKSITPGMRLWIVESETPVVIKDSI